VILFALMYWWSFHYMSAPKAFSSVKEERKDTLHEESMTDSKIEVRFAFLAFDFFSQTFFFAFGKSL
jgi:hypothetical protein